MTDEKRFQDLSELLKQMAEDQKLRSNDPFQKPGTFFFSEVDRPRFDTGELRAALRPDQKIVGSSRIPEGKAYFVEKRDPKFLEIEINVEAFDRAAAAIAQALDRINRDAFLNGFRRRSTPPRWERRWNETITEWGDRLFERGLLDNPKIRWAYQKAMFAEIGLKLRSFIDRFRRDNWTP